MATEITCIVPDSSDPGSRIDAVGGPGWQKSEDTVIAEIDGGAEYYTNAVGVRADVVVMRDKDTPYLRTHPDQTTANNLLSLPQCP